MPIIESFILTAEAHNGTIDITPSLPAGSAVGIRHFHATDTARDDVSTGKRQFMVTAFYPGTCDKEAPRGRLVDVLHPGIDAALGLLAKDGGLGDTERASAFEHLKKLALRAQYNLALEGATPCPVLIYYPGGQSHRMSNAALCEALAARGFVVFALDAPRDTPIVVFPDGRIVTPPTPKDESYIWPRVDDVRFLLDELEESNLAFFAGQLDFGRIGMFGHSRGGYLSNICAVEESRIRAAANMDGFLWGVWTQQGTGLKELPPEFVQRAIASTKPILRMTSDQGSKEKARRRFEEESCDFGGDFISVTPRGWKHGDFATTPWLCGAPPDFAANIRQPIPPVKRIHLLTGLLADFFETYLIGQRPRMALLTERTADMAVFFRHGNRAT